MSPAIADLAKIKDDAAAAADAEIAEKTAERHAYLEERLFDGSGAFLAGRCNSDELNAIKACLGKDKSADMGHVDKDDRVGDQDLVDYVLAQPKDRHKAISDAVNAELKARG